MTAAFQVGITCSFDHLGVGANSSDLGIREGNRPCLFGVTEKVLRCLDESEGTRIDSEPLGMCLQTLLSTLIDFSTRGGMYGFKLHERVALVRQKDLGASERFYPGSARAFTPVHAEKSPPSHQKRPPPPRQCGAARLAT